MNDPAAAAIHGRVASLHLHPPAAGDPMVEVDHCELIAGKGMAGNKRYFNRRSRSLGTPSKRQVTLIEREQATEHAAALGMKSLRPGEVRSNIETSGISLVALIGKTIQVGGAQLLIVEPRTPCAKMDKLAPGLRARMNNGRQGVLAQVIQSGQVCSGDLIQIIPNR